VACGLWPVACGLWPVACGLWRKICLYACCYSKHGNIIASTENLYKRWNVKLRVSAFTFSASKFSQKQYALKKKFTGRSMKRLFFPSRFYFFDFFDLAVKKSSKTRQFPTFIGAGLSGPRRMPVTGERD
jgi:hypothetical protein